MYAEIEVRIERSFTVRVPLDVLSEECEIPVERLPASGGTWKPGDYMEMEEWAIEQCDDRFPLFALKEGDWSEVTGFKLKKETE